MRFYYLNIRLATVILLCLFSFFCICGCHQINQYKDDDKNLIYYDIESIKQPSSMSCWATVYTMMFSWKHGESMDIEQAISKLGEPWMSYYKSDTGLPGGQETEFANSAGLKKEPPANYSLDGFLKMLKNHGPLWIATGDGIMSHARLMIGASGDKSYQNTKFTFIDPQTGEYNQQQALKFFEDFEKEARFIVNNKRSTISLRWQIIHW